MISKNMINIYNYKRLFLISLLQLFSCLNAKINTINNFTVLPNEDKILNVAIYIIQNCLNNSVMSFFLGEWNQESTLILKSSFTSAIPIFLGIDQISLLNIQKRFENMYKINGTYVQRQNNPAVNVIIYLSSDTNIKMLLEDWKDSIGWNHDAKYVIINRDLRNTCVSAQTIFNLIWSSGILSAVYLCRNLNEKSLIYTFNPYANIFPKFWTSIRTNTSFTMNLILLNHLISELDTDGVTAYSLCDNLYYDKTENLNGYNIKVVAALFNKKNYNKTKFGFGSVKISHIYTLKTITDYLNSNITIKISSIPGFIDKDGKLQGTYKDVISGTANFIIHRLFLRHFWKAQTYPYESNRVKIVSSNEPVMYTEKLFTVFTLKVCVFIIITCLLLIRIFKYILEVSFTTALLEFVRMFTTTSCLTNPSKTSKRIFFLILIVFVFLVNSFLQSLLQSINIVPDYSSKIDSIQDLINSNLTLYGANTYKEIIMYEEILKKFHAQNFPECIARLKNGEHIACISHENNVNAEVYGSSFLHVSKGNLLERGMGHFCTEDWPLCHKLSSILSRLFEAGLLQWYSLWDYSILHRIQENYENVQKSATISEFIICFYILSGGNILALVIFILENIIHKLNILNFN